MIKPFHSSSDTIKNFPVQRSTYIFFICQTIPHWCAETTGVVLCVPVFDNRNLIDSINSHKCVFFVCQFVLEVFQRLECNFSVQRIKQVARAV